MKNLKMSVAEDKSQSEYEIMVCHVHVHAEVANPAIPLHHNLIFRLRLILCNRHFEVLHVVTPADKDDASKGYKFEEKKSQVLCERKKQR